MKGVCLKNTLICMHYKLHQQKYMMNIHCITRQPTWRCHLFLDSLGRYGGNDCNAHCLEDGGQCKDDVLCYEEGHSKDSKDKKGRTGSMGALRTMGLLQYIVQMTLKKMN
jgi:hypothetical protein